MKTVPTFKNEEEEQLFWKTHDSTEYVDWSSAQKVVFPNLKKTTKAISLRLPEDMIEMLKNRANAMDVPYQSLIKMILSDGLKKMSA